MITSKGRLLNPDVTMVIVEFQHQLAFPNNSNVPGLNVITSKSTLFCFKIHVAVIQRS